jgi:RNA polymerase sigma-70 factor (ECF subfamily)
MTADPLENLLLALREGDPRAIEQVFVSYLPFLRLVARRQMPRQLRAKFDSVDVVQSVWASLLRGFAEGRWQFTTTDQLRAFLVTVTRRRLSDRLRHYQGTLENEQPLGKDEPDRWPSAGQPRPSELAQADDLWEKMLALCPPAHHEVLRLKRQGLALQDIAARTGLHEGSVRRILRKLARQLALESGPLADAPPGEDKEEP